MTQNGKCLACLWSFTGTNVDHCLNRNLANIDQSVVPFNENQTDAVQGDLYIISLNKNHIHFHSYKIIAKTYNCRELVPRVLIICWIYYPAISLQNTGIHIHWQSSQNECYLAHCIHILSFKIVLTFSCNFTQSCNVVWR